MIRWLASTIWRKAEQHRARAVVSAIGSWRAIILSRGFQGRYEVHAKLTPKRGAYDCAELVKQPLRAPALRLGDPVAATQFSDACDRFTRAACRSMSVGCSVWILASWVPDQKLTNGAVIIKAE
jgi:hypothetical protein